MSRLKERARKVRIRTVKEASIHLRPQTLHGNALHVSEECAIIRKRMEPAPERRMVRASMTMILNVSSKPRKQRSVRLKEVMANPAKERAKRTRRVKARRGRVKETLTAPVKAKEKVRRARAKMNHSPSPRIQH